MTGHVPVNSRGLSHSSGPFLYVFPDQERAYGPGIRALPTGAFTAPGAVVRTARDCPSWPSWSLSSRLDDLTDKAEAYGTAGVPVYLALDMQEERASVLWRPYDKGYRSCLTQPFGEKFHIPDPFGCELDTAGFQAPSAGSSLWR
ncbi:Uma2 family endonuclease [Streptomyces sp. ME02-8801-2C]|uniref:Uma2 family endonuclease n=1 Tax=Streptomyces sp. ME02-8801-2C TaxID=3028680 RepID=UPI0029C0F1F7|nr:Uma2 family endonuclease [Streptomyces sp. ME02-8801-2C]